MARLTLITRRAGRIDLDCAAPQNLELGATHPHQRAGRAARRRAAVHDAAASREDLPDRLVGGGGRPAGQVGAGGGERPARGRPPAPAPAGAATGARRRSRRRPARRAARAAPAARASARPASSAASAPPRAAAPRRHRRCRASPARRRAPRSPCPLPPLQRAQPRERQLVERVDAQAVEGLRRIGDDLAPRAAPRPRRRSRRRRRVPFTSPRAVSLHSLPRTSASLSSTFLRRASRSASTRLPSSASPTAMICAASRPGVLGAADRHGRHRHARRHLHRRQQRVEAAAGCPRRSGTPITGRVVCAATAPARCAAPPAPQMNTLVPRRAGVLARTPPPPPACGAPTARAPRPPGPSFSSTLAAGLIVSRGRTSTPS